MIIYNLMGTTEYGSLLYQAVIYGKKKTMDQAIADLQEVLPHDSHIGARAQRTEDGKAWKIELECRED